jgi:hypothetical protein
MSYSLVNKPYGLAHSLALACLVKEPVLVHFSIFKDFNCLRIYIYYLELTVSLQSYKHIIRFYLRFVLLKVLFKCVD